MLHRDILSGQPFHLKKPQMLPQQLIFEVLDLFFKANESFSPLNFLLFSS